MPTLKQDSESKIVRTLAELMSKCVEEMAEDEEMTKVSGQQILPYGSYAWETDILDSDLDLLFMVPLCIGFPTVLYFKGQSFNFNSRPLSLLIK